MSQTRKPPCAPEARSVNKLGFSDTEITNFLVGNWQPLVDDCKNAQYHPNLNLKKDGTGDTYWECSAFAIIGDLSKWYVENGNLYIESEAQYTNQAGFYIARDVYPIIQIGAYSDSIYHGGKYFVLCHGRVGKAGEPVHYED